MLTTGDGKLFSTVAQLLKPVRYPAVAALGSFVYVVGGEAVGRRTDLVQRIDLDHGSVEIVGHTPTPLEGAAAFVLGGELWIAGGTTAGGVSDVLLRYDPAHPGDGFVAAGRLPVGTANAGALTIGERAYLVGGETTAGLTDAVIVLSAAPSR